MDNPFQAHLQSFLNYLRFEKRYSQHTVISYRNDLEQFFHYLVIQYEAASLQDINTTSVRSWLAALKSDKMTAKSINRKASTLKSFFKYHIRMGTIDGTPMWAVTTPKIGRRLPEFVEEADMDTLLNQLVFPDTWRGRTDKLLLRLFYHTGMRLSEQVNLKESQVDYSKKVIKILGKGNKERIVPADDALINEMKAYRQAKKKELENANDTYFFVLENGRRLYPKYVYLAVKTYLTEITTLNKKSPHILRHTFATHLTNNGADLNAVKALLGHSSLASTQVYTHNNIDKLKEAHQKAHPKA